jgi:hypothetical protein
LRRACFVGARIRRKGTDLNGLTVSPSCVLQFVPEFAIFRWTRKPNKKLPKEIEFLRGKFLTGPNLLSGPPDLSPGRRSNF